MKSTKAIYSAYDRTLPPIVIGFLLLAAFHRIIMVSLRISLGINNDLVYLGLL
jgi:hypothetical protein